MRRIAYVFVFCLAAMCARGDVVKSIMGGTHMHYALSGDDGLFDAYVEYLTGTTGAELIDTLVFVESTDVIRGKIEPTTPPTVMGETFFNANSRPGYTRFARHGYGWSWHFSLLSADIITPNILGILDFETWRDEAPSRAYCHCTVNGTSYALQYGWNMPSVTADTMTLFTMMAPGSKVYHFEIVGKIDLYPVRKGRTGYMYDRVSGMLFKNIGDGAFSFGQDVPEPQEEMP